MKFAYRNAHLLDGTRDMLLRDGLAVLTDGKFCRADFLEAVSNINLLAHAQ